MKLMTKAILKSLPAIGATDGEKDPIVRVKYFCPWNHWSWYGIEFDPEKNLFFGFVAGDFPELGYFSLTELEEIRGFLGLGIERDLYFEPAPLSEIKSKVGV